MGQITVMEQDSSEIVKEEPCALDRISILRLVAYLKDNLQEIGRPLLFEPNDELTRNTLRNGIINFLDGLKQQYAIHDFCVRCDETNNTPEIIDKDELIADITIKPSMKAEFVYIPMVLSSGEPVDDINERFDRAMEVIVGL